MHEDHSRPVRPGRELLDAKVGVFHTFSLNLEDPEERFAVLADIRACADHPTEPVPRYERLEHPLEV
jgi:hypothetical protein